MGHDGVQIGYLERNVTFLWSDTSIWKYCKNMKKFVVANVFLNIFWRNNWQFFLNGQIGLKMGNLSIKTVFYLKTQFFVDLFSNFTWQYKVVKIGMTSNSSLAKNDKNESPIKKNIFSHKNHDCSHAIIYNNLKANKLTYAGRCS